MLWSLGWISSRGPCAGYSLCFPLGLLSIPKRIPFGVVIGNNKMKITRRANFKWNARGRWCNTVVFSDCWGWNVLIASLHRTRSYNRWFPGLFSKPFIFFLPLLFSSLQTQSAQGMWTSKIVTGTSRQLQAHWSSTSGRFFFLSFCFLNIWPLSSWSAQSGWTEGMELVKNSFPVFHCTCLILWVLP